MNSQEITVWLNHILQRFVPYEGRWRLDGVVSHQEYSALADAVRILGGEPELIGQAQPTIPVDYPLKSKALTLSAPECADTLLSLDFGTARSKAFATRDDGEVLIPLAVGSRAGQQSDPLVVLSMVYIADEPGNPIYFGRQAEAKSQQAIDRGSRGRLDSFKAMVINSGPGTDLDAVRLESFVNPSQEPLTDGDVLTLYLAYLTDLAASELEQHGLSRYVRRRFTLPVFNDPERQLWAAQMLRQYYARAILVADEFSGAWASGISPAIARRVVRAAAAKWEAAAVLVESVGVVEPRAAFGAVARNMDISKFKRRLITVVDAGAGTTDFATYGVIYEPDKPLKMFLASNSVHAVSQAGDVIDDILVNFIIERERAKNGGTKLDQEDRIASDLRIRRRQYKEELFTLGQVTYQLSNSSSGVVIREDFVKDSRIQRFAEKLAAEFDTSIRNIAPGWWNEVAQGELSVAFTGGSSSLPMVVALGNRQPNIGPTVRCFGRLHVPAWADEYENLPPVFAQLAVAIGAALPEIPESPSGPLDFAGSSVPGGWNMPGFRDGPQD